jgi:hypothetical protein
LGRDLVGFGGANAWWFQHDWMSGPFADNYFLISYLHSRSNAANSISGGTSVANSNANASMCANYRAVSQGDVITQALSVGGSSSYDIGWFQYGVMAA